MSDKRLRIGRAGLYWQYFDSKKNLIRENYPLSEYADFFAESGFRCESELKKSTSSLDLIQKSLRISKTGLYFQSKVCKKLLIFDYDCKMKRDEYQLEAWSEKLAEMGFLCFRSEF